MFGVILVESFESRLAPSMEEFKIAAFHMATKVLKTFSTAISSATENGE
jgi:hypothetical protein